MRCQLRGIGDRNDPRGGWALYPGPEVPTSLGSMAGPAEYWRRDRLLTVTVLAFLMTIGVEILIDFLMEVGLPAFLAFVLVRALFRRLRVRPHGSVPVET